MAASGENGRRKMAAVGGENMKKEISASWRGRKLISGERNESARGHEIRRRNQHGRAFGVSAPIS